MGELDVDGTTTIPSRGFVVYGRVRAGTVEVGHVVQGRTGLDAPVVAVESLLLSTATRRTAVALVFAPRSPAELAGWQALDLVGQTLSLRQAPAR